MAHLEQAEGLEHPEGVADRAAADAEAAREHALGGERPAGREGPVEQAAAEAVGDLLRNPGFLDRLEQPRLRAAAAEIGSTFG